jgi:MutS domain V
MKAHLLDRECDLDLKRPLPWNAEALTRDLALDTLFKAMARDDEYVFEIVQKVFLSGCGNDVETILYRQNILQDCIIHSAIARDIYAITLEAAATERAFYFGSLMRSPDWALHQSIDLLDALLGPLTKLRKIADRYAERFQSEGWNTFFALLKRELDDEYFSTVRYHLTQLRLRNGLLLSARLGQGNKGADYVFRQQRERGSWWSRLFEPRPKTLSFSLHPRDESGLSALTEIRARGIARVANAVSQSADHLRNYFKMLRAELAFYIGCLNLHEKLGRKNTGVCFPLPKSPEEGRLSCDELRDVCLVLSLEGKVVGNSADADGKSLVVITGPNTGGKSTFLRSVGLAQMMMQCGMFTTAASFCSSLCDCLLTHYRREEDAALESGKLDEELARMSDILEHFTPNPLMLFNESFSATNEREGSEIARQILTALREKNARILFVTHLYELARGFFEENRKDALFLRAQRDSDGVRTFKLLQGAPLETSFGEDLYRAIFVTPNGTEASNEVEGANID